MEPTLTVGEKLFVNRGIYKVSSPERGDIIVFKTNGSDEAALHIGRVIGLPGERVRIDEQGNIFINDELLKESYGYERMEYAGLAAEEIQLGDDEYFVLGDNRNVSEDSRYPDVGNIKRSNIIGRAWLRIYPFSEFGLLTDR